MLALDVGDRRIGVAVSDPTRLVARPLAVVTRQSNLDAAARIRALAEENQASLIVVGIPVTGTGDLGPQATKTNHFAQMLRKHLSLPIETWNEAFSTEDAQRQLIAMGISRARRRDMLDAAAAAVILDDWLNAHRPPPAPPPL
ncbi:MAG: Holliday junction resolvase RuvX [Chloroflexota bacterium]